MKITNKEFSAEFHPEEKDEIILWKDDDQYVGFSVLRSYKLGLGFIPAFTKSKEEDTKALIKIGIRISKESIEEIQLLLSVSKYSKYRSSHFGINFKDKNSPTSESLNKSENSKQPIDLEDRNTFIMRTDPILFFKKETNEKTDLNEIIDLMYNLHLQTISSPKGKMLKAKISLQNVMCGHIIPKLISGYKNLLAVVAKELKDDENDFAVGLFKPYSFQKHITTKFPYSFPFFNTSIRISFINMFWICSIMLLLWFFYFGEQTITINEIFSASISMLLLIIFEFLIPFVLVQFINILIKFRSWFESTRFKFQ